MFYVMEQTGLLDVENPIHMFTLHSVYLARINFALSEWMASFNNHPISTEQNWSPNQLWLNGMMSPENPLIQGGLDDDPNDITFYGEDPNGPSPFEQTSNNVTVTPVNIPGVITAEFSSYVNRLVNPLRNSTSFGVDVYADSLRIVVEALTHTLQ